MADVEIITEGKISNSTTNNIQFTSIPQTYQHLEITVSWRSDAGTGDVYPYFQMNGKTGSEYGSAGWVSAAGSSAAVTRVTQYEDYANSGYCGIMASSGFTTGAFSVATMIVPNYTDTSQHKIMMSRGAQGRGGSIDGMSFALVGGVSDTAAVTQIDLLSWPPGGTDYYASGTSYMLAGYKA